MKKFIEIIAKIRAAAEVNKEITLSGNECKDFLNEMIQAGQIRRQQIENVENSDYFPSVIGEPDAGELRTYEADGSEIEGLTAEPYEPPPPPKMSVLIVGANSLEGLAAKVNEKLAEENKKLRISPYSPILQLENGEFAQQMVVLEYAEETPPFIAPYIS